MSKSNHSLIPSPGELAEELAAPVRAQVSPYLAAANTLTVSNELDKAKAVDLMNNISRMEALTEAKRKLITAPLDLAKKNAQSVFVPMIKECQEAIAVVKSKILEYSEALETAKAEAQRLLAAKVEAGRLKPETAERRLALMETSTKSMTTEGGATATIVKRRVMVIVDEALVPREFWEINEVRLRATVMAADKAGDPLPAGTAVEEVKGVSR